MTGSSPPPSYSSPLPHLSISPQAATGAFPPSVLSPRLPTSPVESSSSPSFAFTASEEKRALAEAEMRADLEARRQHQQPAGGAGDEEHSRVKVIATVLFYLVAAIVMVFANKWVLNAVSIPLTFLFLQLVIAVVLLHLAAVLGYFQLPTLSLSTSRALSPLIAINVVGLTFNTYCLQYVDASFYQVARGLILPFTVLASWIFLSARPSSGVLAAVAVVCAGFFCGVGAEHLTVSPIGVTLGVFSSITTSLHAIVVKKSLGVTSSPMDLAYYNNLLSAIVLLPPLLISGEFETFTVLLVEGGEALRTLVVGAVVTGVFGFLICIAGFISIKVTSPVTHMISSAVRGVIQTLLGVALFHDVVSLGRASGIGFILVGSILYTWVKDREATRAARERREREAKEREQSEGLLLSPVVTTGGANSLSPSMMSNASRSPSIDESRGEKARMD